MARRGGGGGVGDDGVEVDLLICIARGVWTREKAACMIFMLH